MSTRDSLVRQEKLSRNITDQFIAIMENKGVSREELADRLGVTRGAISHSLSGYRNMTLLTISDTAHALGLRVSVQLEDLP